MCFCLVVQFHVLQFLTCFTLYINLFLCLVSFDFLICYLFFIIVYVSYLLSTTVCVGVRAALVLGSVPQFPNSSLKPTRFSQPASCGVVPKVKQITVRCACVPIRPRFVHSQHLSHFIVVWYVQHVSAT